MADPAAGTPSSINGAAIVSEQLTALLLKDEDTSNVDSYGISITTHAPVEVSKQNEESTTPPSRRPLFNSMREALESSGQLKEEPGGYVIKRHSSRQQQQIRSVERFKYRHAKHRSSSKGDASTITAGSSVDDEADAAGYTVIRRRMSCDESGSVSVAEASNARHSQRTDRSKHTNKKASQQAHRPRRGSMSALPPSGLLTSTPPLQSSSVPRSFHSRPASCVLRPPPGLTPAASGWVAKAAEPVENSKKIEEPPVEALWPEMKATAKSDSGWSVTTSSSESNLQTEAWSALSGSVVDDKSEEDDLLTRLGVTL